jgi:sarcosine oxidase subunit alpha
MFAGVATRLGTSSDPVELTHDGERVVAQRGESVALALIAADRLLLSRSPKLHRARGPYCLRGACEGCLVRIDGLPNQPACRTLVRGGERVETQNVIGSRKTDLLAAADFLFPQGIDHHRLLAGVRGLSPIVGSFARRIAGLGTLAEQAPAARPAERVELPVLIVGGGRKGLAVAAELGRLATLADDGSTLGGSLLALDPRRATALADEARSAGATLLERTSVLALSREPDDGSRSITALLVGPNQTRVARCRSVVLATGRHDATPAFVNNELPGIFSARAALTAWRGDVLLGRRVALVGSGRYTEVLLQQMSGAVELTTLDEASVVRALGRERIRGVEVRSEGRLRRIKADALVFDGRGAPSFELAVQAGAAVDFDPDAGYFPRADAQGLVAERVFVPHADPRVTALAAREALR